MARRESFKLSKTAEEIDKVLSELVEVEAEDNVGKYLNIQEKDGEISILAETIKIGAKPNEIIKADENGELTGTNIMTVTEDNVVFCGPDINEGYKSFKISDYIDREEEISDYYEFTIEENAKVNFSNNAEVFFRDNAHVDCHDNANMDISNSEVFINKQAQVFLQGKVGINIDEGINRDGTYNYNGDTGRNYKVEGDGIEYRAALVMHDKSLINMNQGSTLEMSGKSLLVMDDDSCFTMQNRGVGTVGPKMFIQGDCVFIMNGLSINDPYAPKTEAEAKDPLFILDPTGLNYHGQGAKGNVKYVDMSCPNARDLKELHAHDPYIKIFNDTVLSVGGEGTSYVQFTNSADQHLEFYVQGNSFFQSSGNAHTEIHDQSLIMFRGSLASGVKPWKDCWSGEDAFMRPPKERGGPLLFCTDQSKLVLHGVWNTTPDSSMPEGWSQYVTKIPNSPVLEVTENAEVRIHNSAKIDMSSGTQLILSEGGYLSLTQGGRVELTGNGRIFMNGNGTIQMSEGGQINMSGGSMIQMTSNIVIKTEGDNIIFGQAATKDTEAKEVSFTIEELQNLKALLG